MRKLRTVLSLSVAMLALSAQAGQYIRFTRATVDSKQMRLTSNQSVAPTAEMIVQFKNSVVEADKDYLRAQGFKVLGYLPEDAVVVSGNFSKLAQIEKTNPRIHAIVPYLPEFKISAGISSLTVAADQPEIWVVSTFNKGSLPSVVNSIRNHRQIRLLSSGARTAYVFATRSQLKFLASLAGVEHVQANPHFESLHMKSLDVDAAVGIQENEPLSGFETGTKVMKFDAAWAKGFTGKGQIAAYADTGLDVGDLSKIHPDFQGAVKNGEILGLYSKSWEDPMGHGTHVAGSIAGRGTFSGGAIKGGAYDAMLVVQSMWSPMMGGLMPPNEMGKIFDQASADGAIVHSDSWGSPKALGEYDSFAQQVDEWTFSHPDLTVMFAAGNSGVDDDHDGRIDSNSIGSPATAKNCISVGASENKVSTGGIQAPVSKLRTGKDHWGTEPIYSSFLSDNENGIAMFSSRGPTRDGRIKPDIMAPGTNILSTKSQHPKAEDLWGRYNDHYLWSGGTSMATPLAAGAVAVSRQYMTEKMGVKNPTSALMKAVMMHNAVDMYPGQYGTGTPTQEILTHRPNHDEGYGRVDVEAVTSMDSSTHIADERQGVAAGEEKSYDVTVGVGGTLLANMVYMDAPASPNAAQALVNDLDLVLVKPDGSQFSPNDHTNNHEIIEQSGLAPGNYKLIVKGTSVPQGLNGRQPYALIWTTK
jgi:serine protease AprX